LILTGMTRSAAQPDVVRLGGLPDLAAAVPHLLGFVPTDSVVVVELRGPRERLGFSLRLDLQEEQYDEQVAQMLVGRMVATGADAILIFIYTDVAPADGAMPRSALVDVITEAAPMRVRDAVLVVHDRLWSYTCSNRRCCPPEGVSLDPQSPAALALAAAHALHGRAVLGSRDDVVRSVACIGGITARSMEQAIMRAALEPPGVDATSDEALFDRLVVRYLAPPATVSHDEAAQLVVASHDVLFRDELAQQLAQARHDGDDDKFDAIAALCTDICRLAPPPVDAPVCTLAALAGYLHGDGVVVDAALRRAEGSDPEYNFAKILREALERQVKPTALADIMRGPQ
jgi:AcrR family transcriptional regulator